MASIAACDGESHVFIEPMHHIHPINGAAVATIADGEEPALVVTLAWQPHSKDKLRTFGIVDGCMDFVEGDIVREGSCGAIDAVFASFVVG